MAVSQPRGHSQGAPAPSCLDAFLQRTDFARSDPPREGGMEVHIPTLHVPRQAPK